MARSKSIGFIGALIISATLACISCGGGGDEGGGGTVDTFPAFTPADAETPMTLDQDSAIRVAGILGLAHDLSGIVAALATNPLPQMPQGVARTESRAEDVMLQSILQQILSQTRSRNYQASATTASDDNVDCAGGSGTYSAALTWDDDEDMPECGLNTPNMHMTLTMNACAINAKSTMDGRIEAQFTGSICAPTGIKITLDHFTFSYNGTPQIISRELSLSASGLQWNGYLPSGGSINAGTSVLSGQAMLLVGGEVQMGAAFSDYTEEVSKDELGQLSIIVSGHVSGQCLSGWAGLETIEPIVFDESGNCPLEGEIAILGSAGEDPLGIIYNANGSVTIGETSFDSCSDIPAICAAAAP